MSLLRVSFITFITFITSPPPRIIMLFGRPKAKGGPG